jgi:hypothetical protein
MVLPGFVSETVAIWPIWMIVRSGIAEPQTEGEPHWKAQALLSRNRIRISGEAHRFGRMIVRSNDLGTA